MRNVYSNSERLEILRDTDHMSVKDAARISGVTTFTIRHWRRNRAKFLSGPPDERRRVEVVPLSQFEAALIQALERRDGIRAKYSRKELNREVRSLSKQFKVRKGVLSRSWIDRFIKRRRRTRMEKLLCSGGAARILKEARSTKPLVAKSSAEPGKGSARRPTGTRARMAPPKRIPPDRNQLRQGPSEPTSTTDTPRSRSLSDILLGITDAAYMLSIPVPTHEELFKLQQEFLREQRNKTLDENLLSPNDIVRDSYCSDASTSTTTCPWPFVSVFPETSTHISTTRFCPWRFQTDD